ncbi:hypothetical protein J132_04562 [Termitomyces sp. J132]|nr:hypothetical protein J132_04562 [Termitomyces sp. J132]
MEIKGKEEFKAGTVGMDADEDKEEAKGAWSSMPLQQVGNNKLKWLEGSGSGAEVSERVGGCEAGVASGKSKAFLAWQEENNISKVDLEEEELGEVPDNDANLDA